MTDERSDVPQIPHARSRKARAGLEDFRRVLHALSWMFMQKQAVLEGKVVSNQYLDGDDGHGWVDAQNVVIDFIEDVL